MTPQDMAAAASRLQEAQLALAEAGRETATLVVFNETEYMKEHAKKIAASDRISKLGPRERLAFRGFSLNPGPTLVVSRL